jgi:hypothetical protein
MLLSMKHALLTWLAILFFASTEAQIIEAPHFKDISSYVSPDTLIILDIDDTILVPVQMLGCDAWFTERFYTHLQEGLSKQQALETVLKPRLH